MKGLPRHRGAFKILLSLRDIVLNLPNANMNAIYISIVCITFLVVMNEVVKPWATKYCKFPIPTELLVVVGFTALSYVFNLGGPRFNVREVGEIPTGLPSPQLPPLELIKLVAIDSIAVCIVSYSIVMSMSLLFAKKEYYEVRPNQELLALGLSNIVGACFSCLPMSCSLSRSAIQYNSGGKTQFSSVITASIILIGKIKNYYKLFVTILMFKFFRQFFYGWDRYLRHFREQLWHPSFLLLSRVC